MLLPRRCAPCRHHHNSTCAPRSAVVLDYVELTRIKVYYIIVGRYANKGIFFSPLEAMKDGNGDVRWGIMLLVA